MAAADDASGDGEEPDVTVVRAPNGGPARARAPGCGSWRADRRRGQRPRPRAGWGQSSGRAGCFPLGFLDRRKSNDSLPARYFRALRAVLTPSDVKSEGDSSAPRRPLACQQGRSLHGRRSASGLPLVAAAAVVHSRGDPRECDVQQPGGRLTDLRSGLACDAHEEFMKVSSHQAVSFGNRPGALLTAPRNGRIR